MLAAVSLEFIRLFRRTSGFDITNPWPGLAAILGERDRKRLAQANPCEPSLA